MNVYNRGTMRSMMRIIPATLLVVAFLTSVFSLAAQTAAPAQSALPNYPHYPIETPAEPQPSSLTFRYRRRAVMIPMRDGVKLHTVVLVPRSATKAKPAPILLTRTPYNADDLTTHISSAHLGPSLFGYDNATEVIVEGGYIRVVQD